MFGIGNRNSCKDDGVQDLKIENARIKIHAKYIAFISLGILILCKGVDENERKG